MSVDGSHRGRLRIEFSGARVRFANVEQLLLLPAGHYRLSGKVKAEDLHTARGLWWQLYCHSGPHLGHTGLVSGNTDWTDFSLDFDVPQKNCSAQLLRL